jgi:hypothetical protein
VIRYGIQWNNVCFLIWSEGLKNKLMMNVRFVYKVRDGLIRDDSEQFSEAVMRDVRDYSIR